MDGPLLVRSANGDTEVREPQQNGLIRVSVCVMFSDADEGRFRLQRL